MRAALVALALVALAGCQEGPTVSPAQPAGAPLLVYPVLLQSAVGNRDGNPSETLLPLSPFVTLHAVDLVLEQRSAVQGGWSWSVECQPGCGTVGSAKGSPPHRIEREGLALGPGIRLAMRVQLNEPPTSPYTDYNFVVRGTVTVTGDRLVDRSVALDGEGQSGLCAYVVTSCSSRGTLVPLVAPQGPVNGFRLTATWNASTALTETMELAVWCDVDIFPCATGDPVDMPGQIAAAAGASPLTLEVPDLPVPRGGHLHATLWSPQYGGNTPPEPFALQGSMAWLEWEGNATSPSPRL